MGTLAEAYSAQFTLTRHEESVRTTFVCKLPNDDFSARTINAAERVPRYFRQYIALGKGKKGILGFTRGARTKALLDAPALLDYAVKSLSAKMKSERDLRRRLNDRAEDSAAVDAVIAKLKDLGYLSDERFAADYTRLRQENEKFGRRRVQQGLMQKGIAQATVTTAISAAYDDIDEAALCRAYAERKRLKPPDAADIEGRRKQEARIMRRLLAAGFSSRAVWKTLRSLGSDVAESDIAEADSI